MIRSNLARKVLSDSGEEKNSPLSEKTNDILNSETSTKLCKSRQSQTLPRRVDENTTENNLSPKRRGFTSKHRPSKAVKTPSHRQNSPSSAPSKLTVPDTAEVKVLDVDNLERSPSASRRYYDLRKATMDESRNLSREELRSGLNENQFQWLAALWNIYGGDISMPHEHAESVVCISGCLTMAQAKRFWNIMRRRRRKDAAKGIHSTVRESDKDGESMDKVVDLTPAPMPSISMKRKRKGKVTETSHKRKKSERCAEKENWALKNSMPIMNVDSDSSHIDALNAFPIEKYLSPANTSATTPLITPPVDDTPPEDFDIHTPLDILQPGGIQFLKRRRSEKDATADISDRDDSVESATPGRADKRRRLEVDANLSITNTTHEMNVRCPIVTCAKSLSDFRRIPLQNVVLQHKPCKDYKNRGISRCRTCTQRQSDDTECRFQSFRAFENLEQLALQDDNLAAKKKVKPTNSKVVFNNPLFVSSADTDPQCRIAQPNRSEEPLRARAAEAFVLSSLSQPLEAMLTRELTNSNDDACFRRLPMPYERHLCDYCLTSIFNSYWTCSVCGVDMCIDCFEEWRSIESKSQGKFSLEKLDKRSLCIRNAVHTDAKMLKMIKFTNETLEKVKSAMLLKKNMQWDSMIKKGLVESESEEEKDEEEVVELEGTAPIIPSMKAINDGAAINDGPAIEDTLGKSFRLPLPSLPYLCAPATSTSLSDFQDRWRKGEAVLVENVLNNSKMAWAPEYFIQNYGRQGVHVIDCETGKAMKSTAEEFLAGFEDLAKREKKSDGNWKVLKLKDWPPRQHFEEEFPALYEDFMAVLPFKEYTGTNGVFNLAGRLPDTFVPPDLGPKMYIAYGSSDGEQGKGTTNLHCDMADAVNIMFYSSSIDQTTEDKKVAAAVWDIYPADDLPKIKKFLAEHAHDLQLEVIDPVHDQWVYLDATLRLKLWDKYQVRSWRVYQNPGDAVFIPAGCAHQVCNYAAAVKCAMDFVSPENVVRCADLTNEFRHMKTQREDMLQLKNIILFAWASCDQFLGEANEEAISSEEELSRKKIDGSNEAEHCKLAESSKEVESSRARCENVGSKLVLEVPWNEFVKERNMRRCKESQNKKTLAEATIVR